MRDFDDFCLGVAVVYFGALACLGFGLSVATLVGMMAP